MLRLDMTNPFLTLVTKLALVLPELLRLSAHRPSKLSLAARCYRSSVMLSLMTFSL
ncbi:hypothetical protein SAMN05444169_4265 [Bradyrhizobium erythrophlei]|uniref:Uncharacterized protein n=1 Tax=Bradyrhizobium erythrophlei TaxID=1437360 RepID=A0A1M5MVE5_9BRAD|nr:hypothetical protein SAMN05444169_4265 [Bradyrhizobium erythrophlei]